MYYHTKQWENTASIPFAQNPHFSNGQNKNQLFFTLQKLSKNKMVEAVSIRCRKPFLRHGRRTKVLRVPKKGLKREYNF